MASQMVTRPLEKELVKAFITRLQSKYKDHMKYLRLETFDRVYTIGVEIDDDLVKNPTPDPQRNNSWTPNKNEPAAKVTEVSLMEGNETQTV